MTLWDEQTDVLIVGSGVAGLSAAIEARQAGAGVTVIEKMKVTGGNTRISDGGLAAAGNYLQKKLGVEDSADLFYKDMLRAGLGLNHPPLARVVAEKAAEAIEWTVSELGVAYQNRLDRFGGHSVARCLTTKNRSGADLIKAQQARLAQWGIKVRTRCLLVKIITDENGAVRGAQVRSGHQFGKRDSGDLKNIRARRAVVLASGGFGNDTAFRTLQNPNLDETIGSTNQRGATAEGLTAGLEAKAAPIHLSWIQLGPWGCPDEKGYGQGASFATYCVYPSGIVVDPVSGSRIVNEWSDRRQRCDALMETGHACVGLVDAKGAEKESDGLAICLKRGYVQAFDRLADMAGAHAMPIGSLEATVRDYNELVMNKATDAFGKPLEEARQINSPPFYAIRLWPKIHYTSGGLGINANAQVIDLNGRAIPGLFAAGEVCGGIHGASRLGSCALTECIVFGRIAGQNAAAAQRV